MVKMAKILGLATLVMLLLLLRQKVVQEVNLEELLEQDLLLIKNI